MDSMSLRDMCFWVCLASFETGMFVTIEQHTGWGIALIVAGFIGMVGCAWPHLRDKNVKPKYLWMIGILTMIVIAASVSVGIYRHYHPLPNEASSPARTTVPQSEPNTSEKTTSSAPSTSFEQNTSHVANQSPVPSKKAHPKKPPAAISATKASVRSIEPNCDYTAVMSNNIFRNGAMPPNVGSHALMDNNLVQSGDWNPAADITVEGKDSTVRHNTLEGFNRETIHSTKDADRAVIEDNLLRHDNGGSTQDSAGKGADMEKIRKAQTSTIYVPPCPNMGQPFPD